MGNLLNSKKTKLSGSYGKQGSEQEQNPMHFDTFGSNNVTDLNEDIFQNNNIEKTMSHKKKYA